MLTAGVLAFLLTGLLRRYALARSLMDIPNERSSHSVPTPRGGGVAIVLTFLAAILVLAALEALPWYVAISLVGAGGLVALIGFLDDHGHIAAGWRLMGHFVAAFWGLTWVGPLPALPIFGVEWDMGALGYVLGALYLVWLLNLYNFMDGIDGIAGIEAVTICGGASILTALVLPESSMWVAPAVLSIAAAGFLAWNFPPAKIFMGDAGSGFLGIAMGLLSLVAAVQAAVLFWVWVILLGVFVVDATVTLVRRVKRRQRPHEAHRSHAYQYASRRLRAHRPVSLAVGAINLLWLLPWATAVALGAMDGLAAVIVAYLPLIFIAFRLKAGAADLQET